MRVDTKVIFFFFFSRGTNAVFCSFAYCLVSFEGWEGGGGVGGGIVLHDNILERLIYPHC